MLLPLSLRTFGFTAEQQRKIVDFMGLKSSDNAYEGAIGGRFTYSFTPTGLGSVVKVRDNITGEELDVSDYETW